MEIKKNDFFDIEIVDIGTNGEGIGKINNFIVFVENALPKEIVKIKIVKIKKSYAYGKLIEILKPSPFREIPPCEYYSKCGGCNLQHISYAEQLNIKTKKVKDNIERIGGYNNFNINKALGMKNPFYYRNKASFPVNFENEINIGFYSARSHNIVNIENCLINSPANENILKAFRKFLNETNVSIYNEKTGKGLIRHIITRISNKTNEILICVVVNSNSFNKKHELIKAFENIDNLDSIVINFNTKKSNTILGDKIETIYGKGYIVDYIKNLKFNISPLSFYQVNSTQTEILYDTALNFADLKGNEIVFDAYCGIGTISLFLAKKCKKVYGIEIVADAIQDAIQNAKENNILNTEFFVGKSEEIIPKLVFEKNIVPDVIVVDPPRKGCDTTLLNCIVKTNVKKLIYVSCDSATFSRDLKYLKQYGYSLKIVQPVDMFCMSSHIELVALITNS